MRLFDAMRNTTRATRRRDRQPSRPTGAGPLVRTDRRTGRRSALAVALAVSLLLIGASHASAQRLPLKIYTTEQGLAHNRVGCIVPDSHGFLWFCTADGLSRFDGYQFTNYGMDEGLPAPSINDLLEAGDGVYWIATNSDGVVRFDLLAGSRPGDEKAAAPRFTTYPISRDSPVTNRVNVLNRDPNGALWAGTDGGLFRLNDLEHGTSFQPEPLRIPSHPDIEVQVWALVRDREGNLWIGTKFGLLMRSPAGEMTHYAIRPTEADDNVRALVLDRAGNVWVGHRAGLIVFSLQQALRSTDQRRVLRPLPDQSRRYTTADGLANDTVLRIHESASGRISVGTIGLGITELAGGALKTYRLRQDSSVNIGSMNEDRDGNLWVGTNTGGAWKITRNGWTSYDGTDGLPLPMSSMFQTGAGDIYVSSAAWRISRYHDGSIITVRPALPASVTDATWRGGSGVIQDHAGEWWIGTREGVSRFPKTDRFEALARVRPMAVYTTRHGLPHNDVMRLFEDSRGDVWIAFWVPARDVLVRWERATGQFRRYSDADGLRPFTSATEFQEDRAGNVWVGFREGGLARYRDGHFTMIASDQGLPAGGVNGLYVDDAGRLWAALSRGGLCRIDDLDAERPRITTYAKAQGLASDIAFSITGDAAGRIYVSGSRGVDRLDPQTGSVKHYARPDGLAGGEYKGALRDRAGAIWFCATNGLSRLESASEPPVVSPPMLVTDVRVAGLARPLSPLGQTAVPRFELGPGENNIQIDFLGIDFSNAGLLRYQYMLEGADDGWSPPTAQRGVNYPGLASGTYRFIVRTVSPDGTPGRAPATVAFHILPPIWRRWWFLLIAASMVVVAEVAFARSRHRRLQTLRESENRFRTLAETASDAIMTIGDDGHLVLVNEAAEQVFGYRRDEMVGASLSMLIPDYVHGQHRPGELCGRHKNGHDIPLEVSFGEFTRDGHRFYTSIARDISDRKQAEEALRTIREQRLAELERVRKRIATDLHDDIGSSLTRISLLSEVVRQRIVEIDASFGDPLSSIAALARELVDSMSDIVWAINPTKDHVSDLSQRMRHFASDVFTAQRIRFRFRAPSAEREIAIGANVRRELFLVFKEAVNNVVRHSGCSDAAIEFSAEPGGLALHVSDNGRGFDVSSAAVGHGLASMRERTEGLGGHLDIISSRQEGTNLTFTIPLTDPSVPVPADPTPGADPRPA